MPRTIDRQYTPAEDAQLAEARAAGFGWDDVSVLLGRPVRSCRDRYRRVHASPATVWIPPRPKTRRSCMCCGHGFSSEGAHNRLCDDCRAGASNVSPYQPDGVRADFDALSVSE